MDPQKNIPSKNTVHLRRVPNSTAPGAPFSWQFGSGAGQVRQEHSSQGSGLFKGRGMDQQKDLTEVGGFLNDFFVKLLTVYNSASD